MNSATTRVLSALVLIPLLLALIWWAPVIVFRGVIIAAIVICGVEMSRLIKPLGDRFALLVVYVAIPLAIVSWIRAVYGPGVLMILLGTIIASDSGQYFCGRAFGRRKLAPVISPKKTVEGAVGGVIIAAVVAIALGRVWLPELNIGLVAMAGLLIAAAGIAGDLFESSLKRRAGVKDSGNLIPGHGGLLDRIDSWLFAAPVFGAFLVFAL